MKKLLIGIAAAALMAGAAVANDGTDLRALDLPGEPPGGGALGPNRGDVVFPDGPINSLITRRGDFGPPGYYGYYQGTPTEYFGPGRGGRFVPSPYYQ
ncbi:hypothetical protein [Blastochloris viridis]|uniref:Uncharacterized protein n=1 Tax=Blastochloris viridis TaxID=1079 RepID=A0A0P0J843_BLAVI|nr:hypothetical protein [Blastochloris viridis]ALK07840.1 hypothetical protein BVIR_22 [Blastochloris viridis]CUU43762.1 hypothetical protein BVIRIDIS_27880 [Blastochloris viridis]